MLVTILVLIVFSIFNALELYLAFKVGQGMRLTEAAQPIVEPIVRKTKTLYESVKPVTQNDVYEPDDEAYALNEKEMEEEANLKIDEALKTLKQIKNSHE